MDGIIIIAALVIGFYLGRDTKTSSFVKEKLASLKPKEKGYGEPFVVSTDEISAERLKIQKEKENEKERIDVKEFTNAE